ncbi:N-acetylmuramoyl-L-alanine amidase [Nocardia asiatica]|uniref:N-acetylmuramoyl-L-alanine amidase n=1 Tax=Nocardia asiatica TaxID=209252 RepID=UPI00031D0D18|nr:N-acetylmuramoyl-L-alanine amidase [Nocardia asiatica]
MKPEYIELDRMGRSGSSRGRARVTNFLLHTQEGNGSAESLAGYLNNPNNGVSYHYTVRDRVVVDVVDTDLASWSVLDANPFTINLCFAGSRAGWSRAEWLRIRDDIRIAAWLAVQDAKKYGFAPTVIAPPYRRGEGISDHRYVTDCLGIGDHTDVGPHFPWDVFTADVAEFSNSPLIGADMAFLDEKFQNWQGHDVTVRDVLFHMDLYNGLILDQLIGPGARERKGEPTRWPPLGNRTVVEALAALLEKHGIEPIPAKTEGGK